MITLLDAVLCVALAGGMPSADRRAAQSDPSRAADLMGIVKLPDGAPAAGAPVYLCEDDGSGNDGLVFSEGIPDNLFPTLTMHVEQAICDGQGRFHFAARSAPFAIAVKHEQGYAEITDAQFRPDPTLILKPWGRVAGVLWRGQNPRPNVEVRLYAHARGYDPPRVTHVYAARTDDEGQFTIERVPYGEGNLGPVVIEPKSMHSEYQQPLRIEAGQTTQVRLGGRGRPIVGHIAAPSGVDVDFVNAYQGVRLRKKAPDVPDDVLEQGKAAFETWRNQWRATDDGRKWDALPSSFSSGLDTEGAFRLEEVPAGPWTLMADLVGPVPEAKSRRVAIVGRVVHDFVAPELAQEQSDEPLDLGTLTADPVPIPLQVGDDAPAFEAVTLDGRTIRLSDLRGKLVLLDFWATWCGPCLQQMPKLKALYDKFAQHERFVMVGISVDRKREKLVAYVGDQDLRWPQVFVEEGTKAPLAVSYRIVGIPTVVLVGPDGKVLAYNPPPTELADMIARNLAAP